MRQRPGISSVLWAALLVAGMATHASAQVGRVGGIVKDEDNQPLKGATVTAENDNTGQSLTATTDDKGRFTMIGLRAAQWRFIARAPGFKAELGEMPVRMGAPNPPITFALKKSGAANFGALAGIASKDLQADLAAADALYKQTKWDEAIAAYRTILDRAPTLGVINLQIAAAYRGKRDYNGALAAYKELLKADPSSEKAHVWIAITNLERGDGKAAEESLMQAAAGGNAGREIFYNLGEMTASRNESDQAATWYQRASTADPSWGKPLYKLGLLAAKQGDTAGAFTLMDQVIAVDPSSPEAALAKSSLQSLKK